MKRWMLVGMSLFISLLAGCGDSATDSAAGSATATQAQNGKSITVSNGETLTVELAGNPTTGYEWTVAQMDASFLQAAEPTYESDSSAIGSGGTYTFRFTALKAGSTALGLVYRRAWETTASDQTFSLTVNIQSAGNDAVSSSLEGTQWKLAAWSASSLNPADFNISAAFANGQISGRSAVNLYSGSYSAANGAFSVGMLTMTLMASDENSMRAESLYHELLAQARHYHIASGQLVLANEANQDLLIFNPQ
jgi:inhibitor of cysteine peptidase